MYLKHPLALILRDGCRQLLLRGMRLYVPLLIRVPLPALYLQSPTRWIRTASLGMQQHCFIQASKTSPLLNKVYSMGKKMERNMLATGTRTHLLLLDRILYELNYSVLVPISSVCKSLLFRTAHSRCS